MPRKDRESFNEYQRAWYAKNSARVIAKVKLRKHTLYAGVCQNCGGPTVGNTKGGAPSWCNKSACISAHWAAKREEK